MENTNFQPKLSDQTAKELEWFLKERELGRELTTEEMLDPVEEVMLDVIDHLQELRDELDRKINQMEMRTKRIW
jgi:hypothetical protein